MAIPPLHSSGVPYPPPQPQDAFLNNTIRNAWQQHTPAKSVKLMPKSTPSWDVEELEFFKLHYFDVQSEHFGTYICPISTLPRSAVSLASMTLDISDFYKGAHLKLGEACRVFGDMVIIGDEAETSVDYLVQHVLNACNSDHVVLRIVPQRQPFNVHLNADYFKTCPDGSVIGRKIYDAHYNVTVIVMHNNLGKDYGEYQIPGEILGAALHNFQNSARVAQTIFAIRVIETAITVYRADFSAEYLKELSDNGKPSENITIFRALGASGALHKGAALAKPGVTRESGITAIASILSFCAEMMKEKNENPQETNKATQHRLDLLKESRLEL